MNEILDEKKSWLFYKTWNNMFLKLPKAEAGELLQAMCALEEGIEYTIENPILEAVFSTIKEQMLANTERFYKEKERRQNASKKGVEARAEKKKQSDNESLTNRQPIVNQSLTNGKPSDNESLTNRQPIVNQSLTNGKPSDNESLTNRLPNVTYKDKDKDKVEDKDKVKGKDILPPYSPPKGGKADSSLRSESRENVSVYTPPKADRADYQAVLDAFHELCPSLPKVLKLSDSRKKAIKARLNDFGLEEIKRAFALTEQSDFLKGTNATGWQAGFDWLMKSANLTKVLEGNYENKHKAGKPGSMFGEDDYLAKVARGEASIMDEWFGGIAEGG